MAGTGRFNHDFSGKTILVVEDTLMSFKLIDTVLKRVNALVVHAIDGPRAIELCNEHDFDVVIMDIQLPGMNGLEATREIKKKHPALPVIAATANTFDDEALACREAGCQGFLTKPLQFPKLFELLESIFDQKD